MKPVGKPESPSISTAVKSLHVQDRRDFTAGETFLEWLYPLHCGEAFGNGGRAFIMAMGFVPLDPLRDWDSCAGARSAVRAGSPVIHVRYPG